MIPRHSRTCFHPVSERPFFLAWPRSMDSEVCCWAPELFLVFSTDGSRKSYCLRHLPGVARAIAKVSRYATHKTGRGEDLERERQVWYHCHTCRAPCGRVISGCDCAAAQLRRRSLERP